jgi:AcrR family transcriptional regulator
MMCQNEAMPRTRGRAPAGGRADALSQEIVTGAAITLLDEHGERGLTFRLLAERLNTGTGALYWHVANKDELVALAADQVLGHALAAALRPAAARVMPRSTTPASAVTRASPRLPESPADGVIFMVKGPQSGGGIGAPLF